MAKIKKSPKIQQEINLLQQQISTIWDNTNPGYQVYSSASDLISGVGLDVKNLLELYERLDILSTVDDNDAYLVEQGEVGYIEFGKIGTNNLQQCVAVIIDGVKDNKPLTALVHFYHWNLPSSLQEVFDNFDSAKVYLVGGRDTGRLAHVAGDNIKRIKEVIEANKAKLELVLDATGDNGFSVDGLLTQKIPANIIYNSETKTITEAVAGKFNDSTLETRFLANLTNEVMVNHTNDTDNPNKRDVKLSKINFKEIEKNGYIVTLTPEEQISIIDNYLTSYNIFLDKTLRDWIVYRLPTFAEGGVLARQALAHARLTEKVLIHTAPKIVKVDEIYNGRMILKLKNGNIIPPTDFNKDIVITNKPLHPIEQEEDVISVLQGIMPHTSLGTLQEIFVSGDLVE